MKVWNLLLLEMHRHELIHDSTLILGGHAVHDLRPGGGQDKAHKIIA